MDDDELWVLHCWHAEDKGDVLPRLFNREEMEAHMALLDELEPSKSWNFVQVLFSSRLAGMDDE